MAFLAALGDSGGIHVEFHEQFLVACRRAKQSCMPTRSSGAGCFAARHSATAPPRPPITECSSAVTMQPVFSTDAQNGVFVERLHAECVDNLCGNAFSGQQLGGLQGLIDFDAAGDDGNIAALAKHVCATHLEFFARLIDARHRCAAHAHIHGAGVSAASLMAAFAA